MGAWIKPSGTGYEPYWRIYDPIADGNIFAGSVWRESVLAPYAKLVSDKKYTKIEYNTWRDFKCEYDYWVVYFETSLEEPFYPKDVIIEAYNKSTFADKHFTRQGRVVYHLDWREGNTFGNYLVKTYFHNNCYFHDLDAMGNPMKYDKAWNCGSRDENETYKGNQAVGARILYYQLFPQERKKDNMDTTATVTATVPCWNYDTTATKTNIDWSKVNSSDWTIGTAIQPNYSSVSITTDTFAKQEQVNKIDDRLNALENSLKTESNKKEDNNKMKMFNFDFGPIKDNDNIRMSPYGLAVKNSNGTYQAYDKVNGEMMDVDVMNFSGNNFFYKVPVAVDTVSAGDLIIFNRRPCFVFGFTEQGDVIVIDIALGEKKTILPNKSPFGNFSFLTKIVSLFDNMMMAPSAENPMGNMWMWAMMDEDNKDFDPMTMMMMSSMMGGVTTEFNPMMLYFLSKDKNSDKNDLLPLMFMMNSMKK